MCDCPEIQDSHSWADGDLFFQERLGHTEVWCDQCLAYLQDKTKKKSCIWLPTQSQLQKMLNKSLWLLVAEFWEFCNGGRTQDTAELAKNRMNIHIYTSMEQLWLAFYMKEKHDKVWDGDKWELVCPAG